MFKYWSIVLQLKLSSTTTSTNNDKEVILCVKWTDLIYIYYLYILIIARWYGFRWFRTSTISDWWFRTPIGDFGRWFWTVFGEIGRWYRTVCGEFGRRGEFGRWFRTHNFIVFYITILVLISLFRMVISDGDFGRWFRTVWCLKALA